MFRNKIILSVTLFSAFAAPDLFAMKRSTDTMITINSSPNSTSLFSDSGQTNIIAAHNPTTIEIIAFFDNIANNNIKAIETDLKRGFNVNKITNPIQGTPLYSAIINDNIVVAEMFIKNGADIHTKCPHTGRRDLHDVESPEMAKLLLDNGVNPNLQDNQDRTALHCLAEEGKIEAIKELISQGANARLRDEDGMTPYDYARPNDVPNRKEIKEVLRTKDSRRAVITNNFTKQFGQNVFPFLRNRQINGSKK